MPVFSSVSLVPRNDADAGEQWRPHVDERDLGRRFRTLLEIIPDSDPFKPASTGES